MRRDAYEGHLLSLWPSPPFTHTEWVALEPAATSDHSVACCDAQAYVPKLLEPDRLKCSGAESLRPCSGRPRVWSLDPLRAGCFQTMGNLYETKLDCFLFGSPLQTKGHGGGGISSLKKCFRNTDWQALLVLWVCPHLSLTKHSNFPGGSPPSPPQPQGLEWHWPLSRGSPEKSLNLISTAHSASPRLWFRGGPETQPGEGGKG